MILASLLDITGPDLLIIFLIVLLLFGAKKLPGLGKGTGDAIRKFTEAKDEFERELTQSPKEGFAAETKRPWRYFLARLHDGYACAVAAPFPLFC